MQRYLRKVLRPCRASDPSAWRCSHSLIFRRLHDDDLADHAGVVGAAVLRAEQVIGARPRRLEPDGGVAAGQDVHVDAEVRHEKAVDHVLGGQQQLERPADRDVQFVDLALPFGVLDLPHPLLADDVDDAWRRPARGRRRNRPSLPRRR